MPLIGILIYLFSCGLCGFMGRKTTIGFMGHAILALLVTPLIDFLIQVVGRQSYRYRNLLRTQKTR